MFLSPHLHHDMSETHPKAMWVGIGKQVVSFVVGVIVAAFILGRGIQKINEVKIWKDEVAPKIDRMDSKGTLSFEHFEKSYHNDQHRNEERLKELEKDVKELQKGEPR